MSLGGNLPFVFLQGGLMVALPLALWVVAARRSRLGRRSWVVIGLGGLFFVASQLLNTPLRLIAVGVWASGWALLAALALISGFGEELMRWLAMRHVGVVRENLAGDGPVLYGLGHGGVESLALGLAVLGQGLVLRSATDPAVLAELPPQLVAQAEMIAAASWYLFLAGALERALAIALHVGLSLIVASGVMTRSIARLVLAMLWHALANGVAVWIAQATAGVAGSVFLVEAWVALAAAGALVYGAARVSSARAGRAVSAGDSAPTGAGSRTGGSGALGGRS
ncbi:MAG TPA: YhfC family glutamic-type intramembrane protease [Chloroflexota bacterium]